MDPRILVSEQATGEEAGAAPTFWNILTAAGVGSIGAGDRYTLQQIRPAPDAAGYALPRYLHFDHERGLHNERTVLQTR